MSTREWSYSMIDELTDEAFNVIVYMMKIMPKKSQIASDDASDLDKIMGIFHDAADPHKISLEKTAWETAAVEKHLKFLEDMKNENP